MPQSTELLFLWHRVCREWHKTETEEKTCSLWTLHSYSPKDSDGPFLEYTCNRLQMNM